MRSSQTPRPTLEGVREGDTLAVDNYGQPYPSFFRIVRVTRTQAISKRGIRFRIRDGARVGQGSTIWGASTARFATAEDRAARDHWRAAMDLATATDSARRLMAEHSVETLRAALAVLVDGSTPNPEET